MLVKSEQAITNADRTFFQLRKDIVEGIKLATLTDTSNIETFNLTRGEGRSLYEVIQILKEKLGDFDFEIKQDDGIYPKRGSLDVNKAKKLLNYDPKFSLEQGITDYISFLKN